MASVHTFLKEHDKIEEQEAGIIQPKSSRAQQQEDLQLAIAEQLRANEAAIPSKHRQRKCRKVSDQPGTQALAPRAVAHD